MRVISFYLLLMSFLYIINYILLNLSDVHIILLNLCDASLSDVCDASLSDICDASLSGSILSTILPHVVYYIDFASLVAAFVNHSDSDMRANHMHERFQHLLKYHL